MRLPLTGLLLGLLLGIRHAFEPDHLAAVSVIVARHRRPAAGLVVGLAWGAGHTLALFAVGCALALMDAQLPPRLSALFELGVSIMLIALGLRAALRARCRASVADAAAVPHSHEPSPWRSLRQPFLVGTVHGLAGSGGLAALALASLPTLGTRLAYMLLFGVGSVAAMACLTGVTGLPLARLQRHQGVARGLSLVTGAISIIIGVVWGASTFRAIFLPCSHRAPS